MDYHKEIFEAQNLLSDLRFDLCAMKCGKIFENVLKQVLQTFKDTIADQNNRFIIENRLSLSRKSSIDQLDLFNIVRLFEETGALSKVVKRDRNYRRDLEFVDLNKMRKLRNIFQHEARENAEEAESDAYIMMGSLLKLLRITGLYTSQESPLKDSVIEEEYELTDTSLAREAEGNGLEEYINESQFEVSQVAMVNEIENQMTSSPLPIVKNDIKNKMPIGGARTPDKLIYDARLGKYLQAPTNAIDVRPHIETSDLTKLTITSPENSHIEEAKSQSSNSAKRPNVLNGTHAKKMKTQKPILSDCSTAYNEINRSPIHEENIIHDIPFESHLMIRLRQIYSVIYYMKLDYEFNDAVKKTLHHFPSVKDTTTIVDACARRFAGSVGTFIRWVNSGEIYEQLSKSKKLRLSDHDLQIFRGLCTKISNSPRKSTPTPPSSSNRERDSVILRKWNRHGKK